MNHRSITPLASIPATRALPWIRISCAFWVYVALISIGVSASPAITGFSMLDRVSETENWVSSGVAVHGQMIRFKIAAHCPECCDNNVECTVDMYKDGVFLGTVACGSPGEDGWAFMDGAAFGATDSVTFRPWSRCYVTEEYTTGSQSLSATILSSLTVTKVGDIDNPSTYCDYYPGPPPSYVAGRLSLNDVLDVESTMDGSSTGAFASLVDWHLETGRDPSSWHVIDFDEVYGEDTNSKLNHPLPADAFPQYNDCWGDYYKIVASIGCRDGEEDEITLTNTGGIESYRYAVSLFFDASASRRECYNLYGGYNTAGTTGYEYPNWFYYYSDALSSLVASMCGTQDLVSPDACCIQVKYYYNPTPGGIPAGGWTSPVNYNPTPTPPLLPYTQIAMEIGEGAHKKGYKNRCIATAPYYVLLDYLDAFEITLLHEKWHSRNHTHNRFVHGSWFAAGSNTDGDLLCESNCGVSGGWEAYYGTYPNVTTSGTETTPVPGTSYTGWNKDDEQVAEWQTRLTTRPDRTSTDWAHPGLQWE